MSTAPTDGPAPANGGLPGKDSDAITYPLSPGLRKAYEDLYATCVAADEKTTDQDLVKTLTDVALEIGGVIAADDDAILAEDTADFTALKTKIDATNASLKQVKTDIEAVAKKIGVANDVIAGITEVLGFFPAI